MNIYSNSSILNFLCACALNRRTIGLSFINLLVINIMINNIIAIIPSIGPIRVVNVIDLTNNNTNVRLPRTVPILIHALKAVSALIVSLMMNS